MPCPLPHQHPAQPDPGLLICRRHTSILRETLTAIAGILDDLDELLMTPPPADANDIRAARCDPPAPCRLDILDLTDPRSNTPALAIVDAITDMVQDQRHLAYRPQHHHGHWTSAIGAQQARWLLIHVEWLAAHDNIPSAFEELAATLHNLRCAAGDVPPPPLFRCPVIHPDAEQECGGPVRPEPWTFGVRCAKCGERWDGHERLRRFGSIVEATP